MKNSTTNAATKTKIVNINLDSFTKKLSTITVKEKSTKETIYNYPENFTQKMIGETEGKKFRNKLRTKIKFFENNIFWSAKQKDNDKLIALTKEFNSFYKENYKINDYSLKSISQSADELKTSDMQTMIDIIKTVNASITEDKTAKKAVTKNVTKGAKKTIVNADKIKTDATVIS